MARHARIKSEFGIFHITQHGGRSRKLFLSNDDRDKFVHILHKSRHKFNFILHGFCLYDPNTYELLIDVNGGDLSKIMKSINISYAMYAKCGGQLFTDRYKSQLITEDELETLKNRFKEIRRPIDADACYNVCFDDSCNDFILKLDLEDCDNCIKCMNTANLKLDHIAQEKGLSTDELLKDKTLRNQLIFDFRRSSTLSLKSLGELFGGLTESSVSKIINNHTTND